MLFVDSGGDQNAPNADAADAIRRFSRRSNHVALGQETASPCYFFLARQMRVKAASWFPASGLRRDSTFHL
jgi:hypothetical protein